MIVLYILSIIYYYYYCHKYILISYTIIDMKQSINQFIKEYQWAFLSRKSKELIYKKIYQSIEKKQWLRYTIFSWSKYIKYMSVWVVVLFCFSLLQYNLPYLSINNLLLHFQQWWIEAKADYVWVVISWDGSYKVELDNKPVDLIESNNNIPVWSSLVVNQWSNITVKTLDNTTTNIIWPAKITFSKNKISNQIVIDVSYSQHIDIKKNNKKELIVQWIAQEQDTSLVVKTQQKTIIAKNEAVDFSLETQWDNQIIINNTGSIMISSDKNGDTLDLKPNQKILLDAEVELFAANISDSSEKETTKKESLQIASNITKKIKSQQTNSLWSQHDSNEQLFIPIEFLWSTWSELLWEKKIEATDSISNLLRFVDDSEDTTNDWSLSLKLNTSNWSLLNQSKTDLLDEKNEFITIKQQSSFVDTIEKNPEDSWFSVDSIDALLKEKILIDEELLWLLNHIYSNYNKEAWLTSLSNDILRVCKKMIISCIPSDSIKGHQEDDYIRYINSINITLKNNYIITSDIHFIAPIQ